MHRIVAMLLFVSGFFLAVYFLFVGAGQVTFLTYASLPAWLVPLLFFALGLLVWYAGGYIEGEA